MKWGAAVWPDRWWRRPSCSIPTGTSPGVCDSKLVPAVERERLHDQILRRRHRVGGRLRRSDRDRPHQHPSGVAARDAARRAVARSAPRHRARRRVPRAGAADGAARRATRRSALFRDRRGVDRREGDAGSADARTARAGPALRLRPPQGLRHRGSSATPSPGSATPTCIADRSGPTLFDTID